jgi:hypothetical protein
MISGNYSSQEYSADAAGRVGLDLGVHVIKHSLQNNFWDQMGSTWDDSELS